MLRLPVSYFDSTKTGVLISRVMTDAEGIRNLVGTGIVQLVGGFMTAVLALGVLFWLNWRLTSITLVILLAFGGVMASRSSGCGRSSASAAQINAEVTGRLAETLGGIRLVKTYTRGAREERGVRAGRAQALPQRGGDDHRRSRRYRRSPRSSSASSACC